MRWAHSAVGYLAVGGDRGGGAVVRGRDMAEVGLAGWSLEREREERDRVLHFDYPPPTHTHVHRKGRAVGDRQWLRLIRYTEVEMHRLLRNRVCAHI